MFALRCWKFVNRKHLNPYLGVTRRPALRAFMNLENGYLNIEALAECILHIIYIFSTICRPATPIRPVSMKCLHLIRNVLHCDFKRLIHVFIVECFYLTAWPSYINSNCLTLRDLMAKYISIFFRSQSTVRMRRLPCRNEWRYVEPRPWLYETL